MRFFSALLLAAAALSAADWLTFGGDPQRTSWAKEETKITQANVGRLDVEWKLQLPNQAKELNSLTVPVIVEQVFTPRGVKDVVIVAGALDTLFAVDADTGRVLWQKQFQVEGQPRQQPNWLCPNALNATPVVEKRRGGLGEKTVHALSSDGKLHSLNIVNGEDRTPPIQFVPPFSKNWSLNVVEGVLYTATSQGCNGAKSGVYAIDLNDPKRPITFFQASTAGSGIWGRAGVAVGLSGMIYGETGDGPYDPAANKFADSFLGLTAKELKLADYYTPSNREWITKKDLDMGNTSPVVFKYQNWDLVAGSGKEGVIFLLDARKLGGEDHRTPLFRSPLYANEDVDFAGRGFWGALATWEDAKGVRWLYAPAWGPPASKAPAFAVTHGDAPNGSIMAFKVETSEGKPVLTPAWISRDLNVPEPPVVANGMVFAISSGENVRQLNSAGRLFSSQDRATTPAGNATLYAFDAETGKELFSSGRKMPGFTHFGGLAVAGGRVYVTTYDSMLYAFGVKGE
jgi:outer membrane protein assembly factor BamB